MAVKKIGNQYWRRGDKVGSKKLADYSAKHLKNMGFKTKIEKKMEMVGSTKLPIYYVWYLPTTQDAAKREHQRSKK